MGFKIDMTGNRYGRITVKEYAYTKNGQTFWKCECDCGNTVFINGSNLRRGLTNSCGCLSREETSKRSRLNIEGMRFGKLVAVKPYDTQNGKVRWLCKCDCGNESLVTVSNLRGGYTVSCGCKEAPYKDRTGERYGRLTIIKRAENRNGKIYWLCKCDCGNEKEVGIANLLSGNTKSCGCLNREMAKSRAYDDRRLLRLRKIWNGMHYRTTKEGLNNAKSYTLKGIQVSDEWNDFSNFSEWSLNNGYKDGLSIDRIDNSKGYSPDNCRWADRTTQNRNKDNNRLVEYDGRKMPVSELAEKTNMPYDVLYSRIISGMSVEEALIKPLRKKA